MGKIIVQITGDGENRSAQPFQVPLVAGNEIEFSAQDGADTLLVFTAETAAILKPKPVSPQVEIASGASVSYALTEIGAGPYCCQILPANSEPEPIQCAASDDAVLTILSSQTRDYNAKTGRGL